MGRRAVTGRGGVPVEQRRAGEQRRDVVPGARIRGSQELFVGEGPLHQERLESAVSFGIQDLFRLATGVAPARQNSLCDY